MTNLEMIQRFQDTFKTTYTVAKEYLERSEWDILEAFIAYERDQAAQVDESEVVVESVVVDEPVFVKDEEPAVDSTHSRRKTESYEYETERRDRSERKDKNDSGQNFISWVKRNYAKAQKHRLNITRNGEEITSMKLTTLFWLIILAVITFFSMPFLLVAFVVSLFFGVNYKVEGPGEVRHINYTFDKMTNWVDNTFKEKDDNGNRNDK